MKRIEELIFYQCQQTPGKLALSDSINKLSYGQMWDHVCKAENQLKEKGMEKGELVALSMPNNAEAVVSFLAILKAGGIVMLLHNELTEAEVDTYFSIQSPNWLWKPSSLTKISKRENDAPLTASKCTVRSIFIWIYLWVNRETKRICKIALFLVFIISRVVGYIFFRATRQSACSFTYLVFCPALPSFACALQRYARYHARSVYTFGCF